MKDKVSIIIPVYNSEKFLPQCLDSILIQSYENIEIVIVDDGSTDNSKKIINEYASNHTNIKNFRIRNSGPAAARMLGIKRASGKYLMFVDSDDFIVREAVSTVVDAFINSKADIVRFHGQYFPGNKTFGVINVKKGAYRILENEEIIKTLLFTDNLSGLILQAYRKTCFDNINETEPIKYCEDYLINQKVNYIKRKIVVIGDRLYRYRINPDSTTRTNKEKTLLSNVMDRIYACEKTLDFMRGVIPNDNRRIFAEGFQVERIFRDLVKMLSIYQREDEIMSNAERVINSREYVRLINSIRYESVKAYIKRIPLMKRLRIGRILKALYNKDVKPIAKYVKCRRLFIAFYTRVQRQNICRGKA